MRASIKTLLALLPALFLAACGGGGGGDSDSGFNTPGVSVSVQPSASTTTPFSLVPVTVSVKNGSGQAVADGTPVTLSVSPANVGLVSFVQASPPPNQSGAGLLAGSVQGTTAGGIATFRLHTRGVGNATLVASVANGASSQSGSATVAVSAGAPTDPRLVIEAETSTLPVNSQNVPIFLGSPYTSQVTVTWRNLDGTLVTALDEEDTVGCSISNTNGTGPLAASFSTLDDGETQDVNEFLVRLGQGPVNVVAGRAIIFVHAGPTAGQVTLTCSAVDQLTGETVSAVRVFNVATGAPALPGAVIITTDTNPVYAQGANGTQSKPIQVLVNDGSGLRVPDPAAGVNNVRLEIVGGAQGGERLVGGTQSGTAVNVRSAQGVASAIYQAGTRTGTVTIRATADRADNNVDNGIQDPITSTRSFTVSDGRLFDIDIVSPIANAIVVNGSNGFDEDGNPLPGVDVDLPGGGTITIPIAPDGTYSLTVSAIATDRLGNPVAPGTEIRFGTIDFPVTGGFFAIAGNNGDPQECGTLFTSPTGAFTTAGGGVGPGDTLLVFGEESPGNRDLEAARIVQSVQGPTQLTVTQRFNCNDDTGTSVNNGPVLPYVIGRNTTATITAAALTNEQGIASVRLTYPASQLGRLAAIYAQGSGEIINGTPEIVTDVEIIQYPGLAPATLTANPESILGNRTEQVTVCINDALGSGIRGVTVSFAFEGANGTVDGVSQSGVVAAPTGANGCTVAQVTTTGVIPTGTGGGANQPRVRFFVGGLQDFVNIVVGQQILTVNPSTFFGSGTRQHTLTLRDSSGNPVPGVLLVATCTATGGGQLSVAPFGPTNAAGQTIATITATNFEICDTDNDPATPPPTNTRTGTCTFTTASGTPTATVTGSGAVIPFGFSPGCG